MHRNRSSKIIATLGPASDTPEMIESLFLAGVDVFRLNFSHGSHADHQRRFEHIRALEKKHRYPIGIMMDLQGPKIRIGRFEKGPVHLKKGQNFSFFLENMSGDEKGVSLPHPEVFKSLKPGSHLLLNDGQLRLETLSVEPTKIHAKVLVGGELSNNKGVNLPDVHLETLALTEKDQKDLAFGLSLGIEMVALSFVQTPDDVRFARKLMGDSPAQIISKIEKPLALEHLEEITKLSDGLLVARGDLGVEMPPEDVPMAQKRILNCGNALGRPVAVATQMLESMVSAPTPTRAEAGDVSTAVYEGADAVMLSAESAAGQYPLEAVKMMERIIKRTEKDPLYRRAILASRPQARPTVSDAITTAACQVVETLKGAAIVTLTASGSTSRRASRDRPLAPILAFTPSLIVARQLTFAWGVTAVVSRNLDDFFDMAERASEFVLKEGWAKQGDLLVVTAGVPFQIEGSTNILRIIEVGTPESYAQA
ncbi:MAG: pyruvate kinase [bacterium]|nr:pyruvate kinase [bacterium]